MPFTTSEKIKAIARRKGIRLQDLAAALGITRQALFLKLRRGAWNDDDLQRYAAALGCSAEVVFTDTATGEKI